MAKIIFQTIAGETLFSLCLNFEERTISEVFIEEYRSRAAFLCYTEIRNPSYDSLEILLNYYCCTKNKTLKELVEHIAANGFYTPHNPSLRIKIE
jgi:hypothetical protein